jgi:hypothetical protein
VVGSPRPARRVRRPEPVRLYGCDLTSERPLEGFPPDGPPLATVLFREVDRDTLRAAGAPVDESTDDWFLLRRLADGSDYLRWSGLFEFVVDTDGTRVEARPLEGAIEESFRTYLLGQVLSFALLRQGIEPLHATAVIGPAGAVAFLGDTGAGKSTLAADFLAAGHRLLTDDLLVTARRGGGYVAYPGPMRLKLYPGVAARVLGVTEPGSLMNPDVEKRVLALAPEQRSPDGGPVPLTALFVLGDTTDPVSKVAVTRLDPRAAFVELTRYTFNDMLTPPERLRRQFTTAADLAEALPVFGLRYPRELDQISEVRAAVLEVLAG